MSFLYFLSTATIGLSGGILFVFIPQLVIIVTLLVFPALKRLVPWEIKKTNRRKKTDVEHYDIQTRTYYDKKETLTWLNVVLGYLWSNNPGPIKKGFHDFLRGEMLDLYKEIPGCFLQDIDLKESSVGRQPKFSNVAVHTVNNKLVSFSVFLNCLTLKCIINPCIQFQLSLNSSNHLFFFLSSNSP